MYAKKEQEGYPDLAFAFHMGMTKEVVLTESNPTADVSLRLGPKAGTVTGTVTDASNGNLVYPCAELKWKAKPEVFVRGTGLVSDEYRVLIPSNTDVMLKIGVDGYQTWFYPGVVDEGSAKPMRLEPGEVLKPRHPHAARFRQSYELPWQWRIQVSCPMSDCLAASVG